MMVAPEIAAPALDAPTSADAAAVPRIDNTPNTVTAAPTTAAEIAVSDVDADVADVAPKVPMDAMNSALKFLNDGGPSIWAIAALSVLTLALILWKIWRFVLLGAWSKGRAYKAVAAFEAGDATAAQAIVDGRVGLRSRVVAAAIAARLNRTDEAAREETGRIAKQRLAEASTGLRALELIATIAPLLGLLGTVLGMIAAFQALQDSGSRADPSMLAGGIWEALLTTAAGMAVAIPASAALTWFEAVVDRLRRDSEDMCARVFVVPMANASEAAALQINAAPIKSLAAE
jgi:biopolymer transport protein ExbB